MTSPPLPPMATRPTLKPPPAAAPATPFSPVSPATMLSSLFTTPPTSPPTLPSSTRESMQACTATEDTAVVFTLGFDDTWKYHWAANDAHELSFDELRTSIGGILHDNGQTLTRSNQVLFWVQSDISATAVRNVVVGIHTEKNDSACPDSIASVVQESTFVTELAQRLLHPEAAGLTLLDNPSVVQLRPPSLPPPSLPPVPGAPLLPAPPMPSLPTLYEVESSATTVFVSSNLDVRSVAIYTLDVLLFIMLVAFCMKLRKKWGKNCWCFNLPVIPKIIPVRRSRPETRSGQRNTGVELDVSVSISSSDFLDNDNNEPSVFWHRVPDASPPATPTARPSWSELSEIGLDMGGSSASTPTRSSPQPLLIGRASATPPPLKGSGLQCRRDSDSTGSTNDTDSSRKGSLFSIEI